MSVDLIVPFSFGDGERDAAWKFVRTRYRYVHPALHVVVGTDTTQPWSKGRAVANAIKRSRRPIIVIADADVFVSPEALGYAIIAVMHGAAWSMPHGLVYRLSRRATDMLYGGRVELTPVPNMVQLERPPHGGPPGGGIVVTTRAAVDAVGGIDPRFTGFGGDDISFARALDTLVGPCERFDHPMTHLFHKRTERRPGNRGSTTNEALASRYLDADGDEAAMRALVAEHA